MLFSLFHAVHSLKMYSYKKAACVSIHQHFKLWFVLLYVYSAKLPSREPGSFYAPCAWRERDLRAPSLELRNGIKIIGQSSFLWFGRLQVAERGQVHPWLALSHFIEICPSVKWQISLNQVP